MLFRTVFLAVMLAAPLAATATPVSAQDRGRDRAATASAHAQEVEGWKHGRGEHEGRALPRGIARRGGTRPPGIIRRWLHALGNESTPEPESEPTLEPVVEPTPEPTPEPPTGTECVLVPVFVNGAFMLQDCNGNLFANP